MEGSAGKAICMCRLGLKLIDLIAGAYSNLFQQMNKDKASSEGKSFEQRINDCSELIIQNMEKTLQNKMVYMFLKDRKKEA